MSQLMDQLILKENALLLKNVFGEDYPLPNLTTLLHLFQVTTDENIKTRLYDILNHDLGTLLVVEIMIDATHEVTLKRLETGEISKNMKHVHDYYVILKSHYTLAQCEFEKDPSNDNLLFESCHFAMFPFGLVIKRENFITYHNTYSNTSVLTDLLNTSTK